MKFDDDDLAAAFPEPADDVDDEDSYDSGAGTGFPELIV